MLSTMRRLPLEMRRPAISCFSSSARVLAVRHDGCSCSRRTLTSLQPVVTNTQPSLRGNLINPWFSTGLLQMQDTSFSCGSAGQEVKRYTECFQDTHRERRQNTQTRFYHALCRGFQDDSTNNSSVVDPTVPSEAGYLHLQLRLLQVNEGQMLADIPVHGGSTFFEGDSSVNETAVLQTYMEGSRDWTAISEAMKRLQRLPTDKLYELFYEPNFQQLLENFASQLLKTDDSNFFEGLHRLACIPFKHKFQLTPAEFELQGKLGLLLKNQFAMRSENWNTSQLLKAVDAVFVLQHLLPSVKDKSQFHTIFSRTFTNALSELSPSELVLCLFYSAQLPFFTLNKWDIWAALKTNIYTLSFPEMSAVCYSFYRNKMKVKDPEFLHAIVQKTLKGLSHYHSVVICAVFKFLFLNNFTARHRWVYNEPWLETVTSQNFLDGICKRSTTFSQQTLGHIYRFYLKIGWLSDDLVECFVKRLSTVNWTECRLKEISLCLHILSCMDCQSDGHYRIFQRAVEHLKTPEQLAMSEKFPFRLLEAVCALAICGVLDEQLIKQAYQLALTSLTQGEVPVHRKDFMHLSHWMHRTVGLYLPTYKRPSLPKHIFQHPEMSRLIASSAAKQELTQREKLLMDIKDVLGRCPGFKMVPGSVRLDYFLLHFWYPDIGFKVGPSGRVLPFTPSSRKSLDGSDTAALKDSLLKSMAGQTDVELLDYDPFSAADTQEESYHRVVLVVHWESKAFYESRTKDGKNYLRLGGLHKERERQLQTMGCHIIPIHSKEYYAARNRRDFLMKTLAPVMSKFAAE